jgi:hypothetical protein
MRALRRIVQGIGSGNVHMYEMKQACYIQPLIDAGQDGGSVRLASADIRSRKEETLDVIRKVGHKVRRSH